MFVLEGILYGILALVGITVALMVALYVGKTVTMGFCRIDRRLDGKVVLITGGNSGLGYETAKFLALRGADIIIASRNLSKSEAAKNSILEACRANEKNRNVKVYAYPLDLTSQKNTREFARQVIKDFPEIHYFINNSGIGGGRTDVEWQGTEDGHEIVMATNYLGPFALTYYLLDKVVASGRPGDPSRIIHVSSNLHLLAGLDPDKFEKHIRGPSKTPSAYKGGRLNYCNSKLLQIFLTNELARRYWDRRNTVQFVSVHPGVVQTPIFDRFSSLTTCLIQLFIRVVGKNVIQGIQPIVHCVLTDDNVSGKFYQDCKPQSLRHLRINRWVKSDQAAGGPDARKLFEKTVNYLGLRSLSES